MPNKTIYVSDDDLPLYQRAQELTGSNLSAAIAAALRRYVEVEEGRLAGFDDVVVRVGTGVGRKVRFSGTLLGQWERSASTREEKFRVYRSRTGKFVVHTQRSEEWTKGADTPSGWRMYVSSNQSWGMTPASATLEVADSVEELRDKIPDELFDIVVALADEPAIEDLDI
ncbi:EXLDI protein [Actinocrispum wychmicini]|uniref:EXLDI family protein n=1 Tax=Actinocrispum wychmicini TaxID=1213861 RepID=A0A4R2JNS9_9PSEU|nr:EXLDI protein [Actinocrispum wychmicini]TCO61004.1 EXLDI family protein [Actinocrispum wychmicini]